MNFQSNRHFIDLKQFPKFESEYVQYFAGLEELSHSLPWFGMGEFAPVKEVTSYDIRKRTIPALRRVLISMLAGRPMSQVAARVPTTRRTVYKILSELIYRWENDLANWIEIGLIAIWDGPEVRFSPLELPDKLWFSRGAAPVLCLICHHLIDHVTLKRRHHDSSLIRPGDGRYYSDWGDHDPAQAHLIVHFYLGGAPKPNDNFFNRFNPRARRRGIRVIPERWIDFVPMAEVFKELRKWGYESPLPVTRGSPPTHDAVARHFRSIL